MAQLLERDIIADPRIEIASSAELMVTDQIRPLINKIVELMIQEADRQAIRWKTIRVTRFVDPEEGDSQLVIRQVVCLPTSESLDYWDTLEKPLEAWMTKLTATERDIVSRRIGISVHAAV